MQSKAVKTALISGITGQDGSFLAEFLLDKGYTVHGIVRRSSSFNRKRIEHLYDYEDRGRLILHYGDMTDMASLMKILQEVRPDEIYNLAAQSHVQVSFETPFYTAQTDAVGVLNLLEAVKSLHLSSRIYQASTSELYSGKPSEFASNEKTHFCPKSPYGVSKLFAFEMARIYRESYKMFVCNGILFSHESERRGENFVTRKITLGIREILQGKREKIFLGNLDAKRDWGYAKDYVEAMWLMLQAPVPSDYVVATGENHSIKEFLEEAFSQVGLNWMDYVEVDKRFMRPNEVCELRGDPSKIQKILGWKARTSFKELVKIMVDHDTKDLLPVVQIELETQIK